MAQQPKQFSLDQLAPWVSEASSRFNVPEEHIWAVIRAENSGTVEGARNLRTVRTDAVSPKQARGIMQVRQIALDDVIRTGLIPAGTKLEALSPQEQINVGTAYLANLQNQFKPESPEVLYAMYNHGPRARFRMDRLPSETSLYIQKATGGNVATSPQAPGTQDQMRFRTFGQTGQPSPTSPTAPTQGDQTAENLVKQILAGATQSRDRLQSGAETLSGIEAQRQAAHAGAITGQQAAVALAADAAAKDASLNYTINSTVENLQRLFGMDLADGNNQIAQSLARLEEAGAARTAVRAEFDRLSSINPLSNPIGYLLAQIKLPSVAAKNNALADQETLALQNINERANAIRNVKASITANTADQLQDIQLQKAKATRQAAEADLQTQQAKNLAGEAQAEMQQLQIANWMAEAQRSGLASVAAFEERKETREARQIQMDALRAGKKLEDEEETRLNERLRTVSNSLGRAEPMTIKGLKTLASKKEQEAWLKAAISGQLGENLFDSLEFFGGANRAVLRASKAASSITTAEKLGQSAASYQPSAARRLTVASQGKVPRPDESMKAGFDDYADAVIQSMNGPTATEDLSASRWDQVYNPYVAPFLSFNDSVRNLQELAHLRNNIVTRTIEGLIQAGTIQGENLTADQQQQVISAVIQQAAERKIHPSKAAAEVSAYFQAAAEFNSRMNKYELFALPPQTAYLFSVEGSLRYGDARERVNLFDPVSVDHMITRKAKSRMARELFPMLDPLGLRKQPAAGATE